jgi:hypothetical protein
MLYSTYSDLIKNPDGNRPSDGGTSGSGERRKKRSLLGKIRLAALCVILVLVVAIHPRVFPGIIGALFHFEAWRNGVSLSMGRIKADLFQPIVIEKAVWTYRAETGAVTRVEIPRTRAWLAWSNIFPAPVSGWLRSAAKAANLQTTGQNGIWFQELEIDGMTAKLSVPGANSEVFDEAAHIRWLRSAFGRWTPHPSLISVRDADVIVERDGDYFRMSGATFSLGETTPGTFRATQVRWKLGSVRNAFDNVGGLTSLQGARVIFAGLILTPEVTVQTFSVSIGDIAEGKFTLSTRVAAFGGAIEAETETTIADKQLQFDVTGTFSKINVAGLAGFLGLSEAAGGTVNEGRFSFRGTPRDFSHAEATVRLEAGSFQWDSRQWDSLVLGLSLLDRRLQVPELRLRQGKNQLTLKGNMALPQAGAKWWERQFDFKVDADIQNLTELSALMLPEFKYAAGQLFIKGAVSGTGMQGEKPPDFEGQLIVSGNGLQWRTAPIDVVQAALVFHGRELKVITAQCLHGEDYLRGTGQISLGDGSYSGEWRLSARDLATYKAVLTPYFLPAPLGGGVDATWAGTGSGAKHEGKFAVQLRRFHLLGPGGTLPLDAECQGKYQPGEVQLENLRLAEDGTSLTAGVSIGPSAVHLRGLRVQHQDRLWLQGDAFLPLDLWQRWPDINFANLLNDETVSSIRLAATDLDLRQTSRLTGIDWPLAGKITGLVSADGALGALKLGGSLELAGGRVPLNWEGTTVNDVRGTFTLDGSSIRLADAAGKHGGGDFTLAGTLDLTKPRTPVIEAEGSGTHQSEQFQFSLRGPVAKPVLASQGAAPFSGTAIPTATTPGK